MLCLGLSSRGLLEKGLSSHLLRLRQTHSGEDGRGDVTENTLGGLLEAPTLGVVGHEKGYLVGGVAGLGLAISELHLLSVTVVGSDEENVASLLATLKNLANGLVGGLTADDSGVVDTSVTDHVGRSKVVHDEGELLLAETLDNLVGDAIGRHLRGKIVGSDGLVGGNQILGLVASLERENLLDTTVEEEGDVSVLLSLSDVNLLNILLAEPLSENVAHVLGLEGNLERIVDLVLGHGDKGLDLGVLEVRKRRSVDIAKKLGDLADAVGSVVEEEDSIVIFQLTLDTAVVTTDNDGSKELVLVHVTTLLISSLDGSDRVLRGLTLTEDKTLKGNLKTVPTLVAVHSEVSADNGTDFTNANLLDVVDELLHVASTGLGVGVTAITEEVDDNLGHTVLLGGLEEGVETAEVQSAVSSSSALEGLLDDIVLAKLAILDGLVNSDNVLPDNTTGTNVQMSNLRVTHEALGKAHRQR
ncbi:hypothetical protein HG531_006440 [Fusarium graminearum]|nr:hypothetical protein HG531_006440 [Fusarium graminearum]